MKLRFHFLDWPLRVKMAVPLVIASVVPLALGASIDIRDACQRLIANSSALLTARGDQLVGEFDTFNRGYVRSGKKLARLAEIVRFRAAADAAAGQLEPATRSIIGVQPASDPSIGGVAVLDLSGRVRIATEQAIEGSDLAFRSHVREALAKHSVISDIYIAEPNAASMPTVAYLRPVHVNDGRMVGVFAVWVRAQSLWDIVKASNALAGQSSFAASMPWRTGFRNRTAPYGAPTTISNARSTSARPRSFNAQLLEELGKPPEESA